MKHPCTYITANRKQGTLYTGVTSDLETRMHQHKIGHFTGFSADHGCNRLVWYEFAASMEAAIKREKLIKRWRRSWKIELIEKANPHWDDLSLMWGRLELSKLSNEALKLKAWEMGPR